VLLWLCVLGLFTLALRQAELGQVWQGIGRLGARQILALIGLNLVILALMAARWGLALRAFGSRVRLLPLLAYRLAGFGVSYFTPGPQFGGEPLQVHLLHRDQGVPLAVAVSSVFLDRLVDLLANFTFLAGGTLVIALYGRAGSAFGGIWFLAGGLVLLPLGHLLALRHGYHPVAWALQHIWLRLRRPALHHAAEMACQAEGQIGLLLRDQPGMFARMIALAGLTWLMVIAEFWLAVKFLGMSSSLAEAITILTAARLAFLLPLPGGLGALEASQALATGWLGWGPEAGLALSLVIRARDVFLAVLGLWLGGFAYRSTLFGSFLKMRGAK
jgi:glycosyltransferase 2 family protein